MFWSHLVSNTYYSSSSAIQQQHLTMPSSPCWYTQGMKFYAVGLSRAILPHLRHRSVLLVYPGIPQRILTSP